MSRRITGPWWAAAVAVVALALAGCASLGSASGAVGHAGGAGGTARSSPPPTASAGKTATAADAPGRPAKPIWLQSLQMTSAATGWALYYAGNPNSAAPPSVRLARTTDGGRTWTDVTPAGARPLLATPDAGQVLDSAGGERAYLAVTGATQQSDSSVNTTMVFATADGGRSWANSTPLHAVSTASQLSFADPRHGFLLLGGNGGAMGQDPVWLYRTADGGAHWSPAAATPAQGGQAAAGQGPGRIPAACDKYGLAFATATTGWIAGTCLVGLSHALLVSSDGGTSWADQPLPLPATSCADGACAVRGPQFVGGAGFLTVEPEPSGAALLVTRDNGRAWQQVALPAGLQYPVITFFSPAQGIVVAGETQGALGRTFYTTTDGGQTWTPVRQGIDLSRLGVTVDFASRLDGFAWTNGLERDPVPPTTIYATTDSGRTWHAITPRLVG